MSHIFNGSVLIASVLMFAAGIAQSAIPPTKPYEVFSLASLERLNFPARLSFLVTGEGTDFAAAQAAAESACNSDACYGYIVLENRQWGTLGLGSSMMSYASLSPPTVAWR